jgi:hypothetical protein
MSLFYFTKEKITEIKKILMSFLINNQSLWFGCHVLYQVKILQWTIVFKKIFCSEN